MAAGVCSDRRGIGIGETPHDEDANATEQHNPPDQNVHGAFGTAVLHASGT